MRLEMKGLTLPRKYRMVLMLILPLLIVVGAYFLVFEAQFRREQQLAADLKAVRLDLARVNLMRSDMAKASEEHARLKTELEQKLAQMPEEKEVPNLLRQVSFAAQETRTRIKYFAPKEMQPQEFYWELPFEMRYRAPYHSIGYFFDEIRKLERIVHITSFSLEAKEAGQKTVLEGTCIAKTYVYSKEPLPKKNEEKKEGKHEPPKK